jgi:hypothetical protein
VPAPRRRYPTDLTDQEWALLAPLILWVPEISSMTLTCGFAVSRRCCKPAR